MKVRELTPCRVLLLVTLGAELEFLLQRLDFKRYQDRAAIDNCGRETSGLDQIERCPMPGLCLLCMDFAPGTVLIDGIRLALSSNSTSTRTHRNPCDKLNQQ